MHVSPRLAAYELEICCIKRNGLSSQVLKRQMLNCPVGFSRMKFRFQIYLMIPTAVSCTQLKTNTHSNCNGTIFIFIYGKMKLDYSYILCNTQSQVKSLFRKLYDSS